MFLFINSIHISFFIQIKVLRNAASTVAQGGVVHRDALAVRGLRQAPRAAAAQHDVTLGAAVPGEAQAVTTGPVRAFGLTQQLKSEKLDGKEQSNLNAKW